MGRSMAHILLTSPMRVEGNVSRWLAGVVVLGGWSCTSAALAAGGASSIRVCQFVYYCEAVSEQRATRRIVAPGHSSRSPAQAGASASLGVTAPNAHAWKCQPHTRVAKSVAKSRLHKGVCLIRGKRIQMSSGTRTKKGAEETLH
jgi:hypothetical protein